MCKKRVYSIQNLRYDMSAPEEKRCFTERTQQPLRNGKETFSMNCLKKLLACCKKSYTEYLNMVNGNSQHC